MAADWLTEQTTSAKPHHIVTKHATLHLKLGGITSRKSHFFTLSRRFS